ncbi:hypothetical protein LTS18_014298 [Coniosporium uncinatum]|uniref:Uncharacterized protein n=1 Tax=Coniosporium uncinatum TaxID=93489 RepID=A0ACC3D8X8_9PEZI|nr:hypothetical protein LTS18_014298 [Coniosporium uncinatum]
MNEGLAMAFNAIRDTKTISTWTVFAFQLLEDIHAVLETKATAPFSELKAYSDLAISAVKSHTKFTSSFESKAWTDDMRVNTRRLLEVTQYIARYVHHDRIPEDRYRPFRPRNGKSDIVAAQPFRLHLLDPKFCGYVIFRISSTLQMYGLAFCSDISTVINVAHPYNAARRLIPDSPRWPDMDALISIHGARHIFVGSPPTNPQHFISRFWLACRSSPSQFAHFKRAISGEAKYDNYVRTEKKRRLTSEILQETEIIAKGITTVNFHGTRGLSAREVRSHAAAASDRTQREKGSGEKP